MRYSMLIVRSVFPLSRSRCPGGIYNPPRDPRDLYTPRLVKGKGRTKVGLCPICVESPSRGGRGQKLWLSMKFSAFKWSLGFPFSSYDYPNISYQSNLAIFLAYIHPFFASYHMQFAHGKRRLNHHPPIEGARF